MDQETKVQKLEDALKRSRLFLEDVRTGMLPKVSVEMNAHFMSLDIATTCIGCDIGDECARRILVVLKALSIAGYRYADQTFMIEEFDKDDWGWMEDVSINDLLSLEVLRALPLNILCGSNIRPIYETLEAIAIIRGEQMIGADIPALCEKTQRTKGSVTQVIKALKRIGVVRDESGAAGGRKQFYELVPMREWPFSRFHL